MRAIVCPKLGDLSVLEQRDLPTPKPGPGQVRVKIAACGVNFADSLVVAGKYQNKLEPPFIPGFEIAGTVDALGTGVADLSVGDAVMSHSGGGGYAEFVCLPADGVSPIPAALDPKKAAGFAIVYGTGWLALKHRAKVQSGEVLAVHAAAGGVGRAAVEIGKALGATVIATAGGAEKLAVAEAAGADHLIDYRQEDVRTRIKALTDGRGANVHFDPVGGDIFTAALRSVAFEGRILVIGFAGGEVPQIPANHVLVKNADIIGLNWGTYETAAPQVIRACFEELGAWAAAGKIQPEISASYALEDAAQAISDVANRKTTGKVVVCP